MPNDYEPTLKGGSLSFPILRLPSDWELKLKAAKEQEASAHPENLVRLTLTFAFLNDVDDIKGLRRAFRPSTPTAQANFASREEHVAFYFFDEENVVIHKAEPGELEGVEVTGKVGDAFRVVFYCPPDVYEKAKKIEPRVVQ